MYNSFENKVKRAERTISDILEPTKRDWFDDLLSILKGGNTATVVGKNGKLLDVTRIAGTFEYASFFDVFNIYHLIDTSVKPVQRDKRGQRNSYSNFFK